MTKLYWKNYHNVKSQLSIIEKNWLFDKGSLTKRLIQLSQNKFSLEILSEAKQYLREDECKLLNIPSSQSEWVREVILKGNNIPWVHARSIMISDHMKQDDPYLLKNIGKTPLGSFLFDKGNFERSSIEIARYSDKINPKLWVRRSIFKGKLQNVLVQEMFLLDFWININI